MKKRRFTVLCLFGGLQGFSQSISPEVIASAGDSFQSNTVQLDWTIGELAIHSLSNTDQSLTEGFHQPYFTLTPISELPLALGQLALFPNPTADLLALEMTFEQEQHIELQLFDRQGKLVWTAQYTGRVLREQISLKEFANGAYFLSLQVAGSAERYTYKIQKHH